MAKVMNLIQGTSDTLVASPRLYVETIEVDADPLPSWYGPGGYCDSESEREVSDATIVISFELSVSGEGRVHPQVFEKDNFRNDDPGAPLCVGTWAAPLNADFR